MDRLGKNCARATPICALAAISVASACWISGRRSSSCEGNPVGRSCGGGARAFGIVVRDGPGILAKQKRDRILLLLNLLFELRHLGGRRIEQLLCLANIGQRNRTSTFQSLRQIDGVLPDLDGILRNFELRVERAKLQISRRHLLHQRQRTARCAQTCASNCARRPRSVCDRGPRSPASTQPKG